MMMAPGSLPPLMKSLPPPIRHSQVLAAFLARAIDLGYLRANDPQTIAHALVGAINNYAIAHTISTAMPESESIDPDLFIDRLIDTIWSGIAPEH
jgi:AcrR family transcriptional regulator